MAPGWLSGLGRLKAVERVSEGDTVWNRRAWAFGAYGSEVGEFKLFKLIFERLQFADGVPYFFQFRSCRPRTFPSADPIFGCHQWFYGHVG